jgi:VanZ family protein
MYVQSILKNMLIYETVDTIYVIIRVCGHITQYMIFGYLSLWMILIYQVSWYNIFGIIVVMFIDEGLQSVTPGRHAEFKDILMDAFGVMISFVLYLLSKRLFKKYGG